MELKVGMYVRFKDKRGNTYIRKIIEIPKDNRYASIYLDEEANYSKGLSPKNILKASHNIIDLIEEGDYVNGYKVVEIGDLSCYDNRIGSKYIEIDFNVKNDNEHWCEDITLQNPDIKSIVTKEQFESMSYKVGD